MVTPQYKTVPPMTGTKIMAVIFYVFSAIALLQAFSVMVNETNAIHQILTAVYFASFLIALAAGCLLHAVASLPTHRSST